MSIIILVSLILVLNTQCRFSYEHNFDQWTSRKHLKKSQRSLPPYTPELFDIKLLNSITRTIACKCKTSNHTLVLDDNYIGTDSGVYSHVLNRETMVYTFVMNVIENNERHEDEHYCSYIEDYIHNQADCTYFNFNFVNTFLCKATPNKDGTIYNLKCKRF